VAKFEPEKFKDGYEAAVKELVEAKLKHLPVPKDEVEQPRKGQVINLMDALKKSVAGGAAASAEAAAATGKKKPAASVKSAAAKPETAKGEKKGISLVKAQGKRKSA